MSYDPATVKLQVIALLNLSERDDQGIPSYTDSLGDTSYASEELDRAVVSASSMIMQAICETEGHEHRGLFTNAATLTHGAALPMHYGPIGVPRITPYSGASYTLSGKVKSVEEIAAYRANVNNRYSLTAHNAEGPGGNHSKLAGFYAIDNNSIFFTGFSADTLAANFDETDAPLLPDSYHQLGIDLAIWNLKKDGDNSDIFSNSGSKAVAGIALIRGQKQGQPSLSKTIGTRDTGEK